MIGQTHLLDFIGNNEKPFAGRRGTLIFADSKKICVFCVNQHPDLISDKVYSAGRVAPTLIGT